MLGWFVFLKGVTPVVDARQKVFHRDSNCRPVVGVVSLKQIQSVAWSVSKTQQTLDIIGFGSNVQKSKSLHYKLLVDLEL
jgi:hypothetical protein